MIKKVTLSVLMCMSLLGAAIRTQAQCTGVGQNPTSSFPLCGTGVFTQTTVPACDGGVLPIDCGDGEEYAAVNPYWYKFNCFTTGLLGFTITPLLTTDDYDWVLFDITGIDPMEVFNDPATVISYNFSGLTGPTGARASGVELFECSGTAYPKFCARPTITAGHEYMLMLSHWTADNQSGYTIQFTSGADGITDGTPPQLTMAATNCAGTIVGVKLNKPMKCETLVASDFVISPALATVTAISGGTACDQGFDMDSVTLTLSNALPAGSYAVVAKTGTDGNTILDNCDVGITVNATADFKVIGNVVATVQITASATNIQLGQSVTFTATGTNLSDNVGYIWYVNGIAVGDQNPFTTTTLQNQDVVTCMVVNNTSACVTSSSTVSNGITITIDALPLSLLYFNGVHKVSNNELNWKTAQESNIAYYSIQRSNDGNVYKEIGKVNATGSGNGTQLYQFIDKKFEAGTNFYKLKIVDKDATTRQSNTIALRSRENGGATIYPNPVKNTLFVQINAATQQKATLQVYDMQQRLIIAQPYMLQPGNNGTSINVASLPAGGYMLTIVGNEKTTLKFVKN